MSTLTVVLISDIDDTIAISHIVNNSQKISDRIKYRLQWLGHAFDKFDHLAGMDTLYQFLHHKGVDIRYVSGMPKFVNRVTGGGASKFLEACGFPVGEHSLTLRKGFRESTLAFKVRTIKDIINTEFVGKVEPSEILFLLVGDNGEKDIEVYAAIVKEFPEYAFVTYIHKLYEKGDALALLPGQNLYVTPAELAVQLYHLNHGLVQAEDIATIFAEVLEGLEINPKANGVFGHIKERLGRYLSIPPWAVITPADLAQVQAALAETPVLPASAATADKVYQAIEQRVLSLIQRQAQV
jgi:hypothetical protein